MLDESIVQFHGRIRVHATKRVESKRNEVMAVPDTDVLVRLVTYKVKIQAAALGSHGARCPKYTSYCTRQPWREMS